MNRVEFIKYLETTDFIKGGFFDYFQEIDIQNGFVIYISIGDLNVSVSLNNEQRKDFTFDEFKLQYDNDNLLYGFD